MSEYIKEAFKQFRLLEDAEDFSLNPEGLDTLGSFINQAMDDEDDSVEVFDLDAKVEDELKQSYVGKVICDCNVCHSNIFKNKEDIVVDENGVANVDDECPYCMSSGEGYTIVGEIKPYTPEVEDEIESALSDEEDDDELADEPIEIEDEDDEEAMQESLRRRAVRRLNESARRRARRKHLGLNESSDGIVRNGNRTSRANKNKIKYDPNLDRYYVSDDSDKGYKEFKTKEEATKYLKSMKEGLIQPEDYREAERLYRADSSRGLISDDEYDSGMKTINRLLDENIENMSIDTEDETLTVTTKDDGGISIDTAPRFSDEEDDFDGGFYDDMDMEGAEEVELPDDVDFGDEVIAPLSDDTEDDIEENSEEAMEDSEEAPEDMEDFEVPEEDEEGEVEVEPEEFDEESFDNLGESYLRKCYNNVRNFKTTQVRINENLLKVHGIITFKSGNQKKTNFVFESKSAGKGKLIFEGYNQQINPGKKAFRLSCGIKNRTLIPEALNYNYKGRNSLNESVNLKGSVKVRKSRKRK